MTTIERKIASALISCSFLPGSFDKRFIRQLPNWENREMTEKGREKMIELLHKYRRQIPNHVALKNELHQQTTT
jgi:hypothetical protein